MKSPIAEVLEEYPYEARGATQTLLRKVKVRREDGTVEKVWQRFDDDSGDWKSGYKRAGVEPDLFWRGRLEKTLQEPGDGFFETAGQKFYYVDGEKDVMTAWGQGRSALCSPHGMGHVDPEAMSLLAGRTVLVIPDQDGGEGDKQAAKARARFEESGCEVSYRYPRPGCKDLTDHFAAGWGWDDLLAEKPGGSGAAAWVDRYVKKVEEGAGRNNTGFDLACQLRDLGLDRSNVEEEMRPYWERVKDMGPPDYDWRDVEDTVASVFSRGKRETPKSASERESGAAGRSGAGTGYGWNDYGNGRRLVDAYGERLRYVHPWKTWLVWDGARWAVDADEEVMRLMDLVADSMWAEVGKMEEDQRKAWLRFVNATHSLGSRRAALGSAATEREVAMVPDGLDVDPWLLNVRNGTLDLRTGELLEHDPVRNITKLAPVEYQERAVAPTWLAFTRRAFPEDETRRWVRRVVGYCLTGSTREKGYFQLLGETNTGKTVFIETVARLLGPDYSQQMKSTELMSRRVDAGSNNDGIADLKGKRFASISEPAQGSRLDVASIKHITGGGQVRASRKYERAFQFRPEVKIVIDTNHELIITDADDSIWERTNVVPFKVRIPKEEQDPDLALKLEAELPGILAWALAGCLEWQKAGLSPPREAVEAEEEYRSDQDQLAEYVENRLSFTGGSSDYLWTSTLRRDYLDWCEDNKVRYPLSTQQFGIALRARSCTRRTMRNPETGRTSKAWIGVAFRPA